MNEKLVLCKGMMPRQPFTNPPAERTYQKTSPPGENPIVVSLFAGAGGLDVGLENAGFNITVAVDNDPVSVATLQHNQMRCLPRPDGGAYLAGTRILELDITKLSGSELIARNSPIDLLVGGPPCQPFSSAGKMLGFGDPRGTLFADFVRIAAALRPSHILFENVRGLVTARGRDGKPGSALKQVLSSFEEIGYFTNASLLNAADFGSFQRRIRLFILMSREGLPPEFPNPTHQDPRSRSEQAPSLFGDKLMPWRTLGEFLHGGLEPKPDELVRPSARLSKLLEHVPSGSGLRSAGTIETTRPGGHWGYRQGTFIADLTMPARTVTASSCQDWVRWPEGTIRRLTLSECKTLQGFPTEWDFLGPKAAQFRQVGNAVPAQFGETLGRSILRCMMREQGEGRGRSMPLPKFIHEAISYTMREEARNGDSRRRKLAKGLGAMS
jgi:DNA (cytosine-5)-methyltransferase 1